MKRSKTNKASFISIILAAFCLMVGGLAANSSPAHAAAQNPRIEFENIRETAPHLYVKKTVESEDSRYPIPDNVVFTFTLKLQGSLVDELSYRVFNESGQEIFRYDSGEETTEDKSNKVPYQTDQYGTFTLKAGQTAKFEFVGAGKSYEITELPVEGFTQKVPADGTACIGTVVSEGAVALFTNLYSPRTDAQMTKLVVNKETAFPAGYAVPESPEFTFNLKLKNKTYALEDYEIIDTLTQLSKGSGTTDENGGFQLKIGESAVFHGIPSEADYEISEQTEAGWRVVGETVREGATQAPATVVTYTNVTASFAVTKKLSDNSKPETGFTFQLTNADQDAISYAKYYLYNTTGERADDQIYQTDNRGKFELAPGQAAIFFGIEPGTIYNVSEEGRADYVQTVPLSGEGYKNKVVTDAVEILPFVNEKVPEGKALTVTKLIDSEADEMPMGEDVFTFLLTKKVGEDQYEAVADAEYSITIGGETSTYTTGQDGKFTLKKNQTARFGFLEADASYRVEEVELSEEYRIETSVQDGTLTDDINFTFTNIYKSKKVNLKLHKKNNQKKALEGAEFDLYADELLVNKINETELVSDQDGNITIEWLKTGTYYLAETKSPAGYQLLANPIKIEIVRDNEGLHTVIDGIKYQDNDPEEDIYIASPKEGPEEIHITVYNYKNFGIPIAGGRGILVLVIGGLLVLAVLSAAYIKKKKTA